MPKKEGENRNTFKFVELRLNIVYSKLDIMANFGTNKNCQKE
jgi:hypothetical protein